MNVKRIVLLLCFIAGLQQSFSQTNFKVMFYNLLNYPLQTPDRSSNLSFILNDYQPDIFAVCELNNAAGAADILGILQAINPNYAQATFVTNTSDDDGGDQNDLQNLIYYDSSKFTLEAQDVVPTNIRDFNHYTLRVNTDTPVRIEFFVGHLKASSGSDNEFKRFLMVQELVTYLEGLPNDSNVVLAGDLNLYTSSEDAFMELGDGSNWITFQDPANRVGSWHNNTDFIDMFSQSTRTSSGLGGAGGGFDDRFDFILTSENMIPPTSASVHYEANSYKVYGNNANINCYNREINSTDCSGADYSELLRDHLYTMSDHLPVVLNLETPFALSTPEIAINKATFKIVGGNLISEKLNLLLNSSVSDNEFIIYSVLGQELNRGNIKNNSMLSVDVSRYSKGIYYVKLLNSDNTLKFIKQ